MTRWAYYNEHDPGAAAWLRELIRRDLIAPGEVDERSIEDVCPDDLRPFRQCHFFAGIGGWSYALRLAGWPDDRPVWTGSCPCQPFSAAGKGLGTADERHLWPALHWLIGQCRPDVVFGEQVAGKAGVEWLGLVHADLERLGYAVGAADLCAASVGAPHIRQRLYWVADTERRSAERQRLELGAAPRGDEGEARERQRVRAEPRPGVAACGLGDASGPRSPQQRRGWVEPEGSTAPGFWSDADWIPCRDGVARPVEPGTFPLAHGLPARVVRLRGYGNAIVPALAAQFIGAWRDVRETT